ncbi:hypothetical protein MBRA_04645 [Methylobacterium brachiatum]|nr:hypothetical protein MBRA_04645 [Methylobacterium brachiatum]
MRSEPSGIRLTVRKRPLSAPLVERPAQQARELGLDLLHGKRVAGGLRLRPRSRHGLGGRFGRGRRGGRRDARRSGPAASTGGATGDGSADVAGGDDGAGRGGGAGGTGAGALARAAEWAEAAARRPSSPPPGPPARARAWVQARVRGQRRGRRGRHRRGWARQGGLKLPCHVGEHRRIDGPTLGRNGQARRRAGGLVALGHGFRLALRGRIGPRLGQRRCGAAQDPPGQSVSRSGGGGGGGAGGAGSAGRGSAARGCGAAGSRPPVPARRRPAG